ncbi:MFS transporter [Cohnella candidum]|nr:MFS transporter [Cohnella candidum]
MTSIWKDRMFIWFASGQTLAQFGAAIAMFAIPWMLLQKTGSAASTGLAFAVGFIPYLSLSLPAGVWADRFSRSKMMIAADLGRLLTMTALPVSIALTGDTPVILLFVVQAVLSAFAAIFDAAYGAYLPQIVPVDKLSGANSALQSGSSLSQVLGPALGGTLLAWLGGSQVLLLTTVTYLISVATILKVRRTESPQTVPTTKRRLRKEIGEGFAYVWNHKLIRTTGIFSMLANLAIPATSVALLFKLQKELVLNSDVTGWIMAGWSAGAVIGSIVYGQIKKRLTMKQILAGVLLFMLVPPLVLTATSNLILLVSAFALSGLTVSVWNITLITMRQTVIPPEIMGRALTSIRIVAWCSLPIGNVIGGGLAQGYGSSAVFVFDASVRLFMLVLSLYLFRQMGQAAPSLAISK